MAGIVVERVIEGRDAQLGALAEVRARTERELNPTDPPPPAAELAGEPAGFSVLFVNGHRPQLAWQADTGVVDGHRGHGLGRWLKAENLEQALAVEPRIEVVETYNAESNPWMLEINVAMGFAAHMGYQAWQADAVGVRAAIGA